MRNLTLITLTLFSLLTVLTVAYAALYTWPNVEDLELSIAARDTGVWRSVLNMSVTYDGRYTTNLLHATSPLVFNKVGWYKYMVVATLLIFLLGSYVAVGHVFKQAKHVHKAAITLFFTSSILLSSPSLFFSVYSVCSSYTYFYPCIFILPTYVSVQMCLKAPNNKFALFLLSTLLIFLCVGFNEVFLPFFVILSLVVPSVLWFHDRERFKHALPLSLITLSFVLFFVTMPSALKKMNGEAPFTDFLFIKNSLIIYLRVILRYVASLSTVLLFLASYFFHDYHSRNFGNRPLVYMSLTVIPYLMTLPFFMAYPTTESIPERIYIPVVFLLYTVLFFFVFPAFWQRLLSHMQPSFTATKPIGLAVTLLMIVISVSVYSGRFGNMGTLVTELRSGAIRAYHERMAGNYARLLSGAHSNSKYVIVCVEETVSYPQSIFSDQDIENDRRHSKWNRFYEAYFNIDEIRVVGKNVNKFTSDKQ